MNMPSIPARTAKIIGAGVLAASLLGVTGCSSAESTPNASSNNSTPAVSASAAQQPASLRGKLVRVIGGDTVELLPVSDENGQPTGEPNVTVHILGIKAPAADACGGPESTAELTRILNPTGFFRVKYDAQSARVDAKGNTQGYLISGDGTGTPRDVGSAMVSNGFAAAWYDSTDHEPKNYATDSATTKAVQAQKSGIWAKCPAASS